VPGQLIPAGLLVMVPAPDAGAVTVSRYVVGEVEVTGVVVLLPPHPARMRRLRAHNATEPEPYQDFMANLLPQKTEI